MDTRNKIPSNNFYVASDNKCWIFFCVFVHVNIMKIPFFRKQYLMNVFWVCKRNKVGAKIHTFSVRQMVLGGISSCILCLWLPFCSWLWKLSANSSSFCSSISTIFCFQSWETNLYLIFYSEKAVGHKLCKIKYLLIIIGSVISDIAQALHDIW